MRDRDDALFLGDTGARKERALSAQPSSHESLLVTIAIIHMTVTLAVGVIGHIVEIFQKIRKM